MGIERVVDPDGVRRVAGRLETTAEEVDERVGTSMPEAMDAGPFTPLLLGLVNAVAADHVGMVMRLDKAAEKMREAADRSEHTEQDNAEQMVDILDELTD